MTADIPSKQCKGPCGAEKPLSEFNKDRSRKGGHTRLCKACSNEKSRQYYEANKEAILTAQRAYRDANLEVTRQYYEANKEAFHAAQRRYRETHHEAMRESERKYYWSHLKERSESSRLYREANKEELNKKRLKRHDQLRADIFRHYGEKCACCGSAENLTIDHVGHTGKTHRKAIGKSAGVSGFYQWLRDNDYPGGYQTLCQRCNASKGRGDRCILSH